MSKPLTLSQEIHAVIEDGATMFVDHQGREYVQVEPGNSHASERSAHVWARLHGLHLDVDLYHVERVRDFPNPDRFTVIAYSLAS